MIRPPSARTRALETLLARVQDASACLSNYGNWEDRARSYAAEDEVARMDAEAEAARHALAEAKPALEALVAATRAEAPEELTAWIDAHDAYLAAFIDDCNDKEYTDGFPTEARAKWAAVRAGEAAYVVDSGGVTASSTSRTGRRYGWLFGIDPVTLAVATFAKPEWLLAFRAADERPVSVTACAGALAAATGVPATTTFADAGGNPRDGYWRGVTIAAGPIELASSQNVLWNPVDSDPLSDLDTIRVKDAPDATFAGKVALWHAVREAFAALGCTDITLAARPAWIVDEAVSAGEIDAATQLRKEITAALVTAAATHGVIDLRWTRPDDIGAVLAAYPAPLRNGWVTLDDCGLRALPPGLARFAADIESLRFQEERLDGAGLRGVELPKLARLDLSYCGLRYLRGEDLAGFPNLTELGLACTQLVSLDADVIAACPKLARVTISNTPFAGREDTVAELRAKWPGVTRWD